MYWYSWSKQFKDLLCNIKKTLHSTWLLDSSRYFPGPSGRMAWSKAHTVMESSNRILESWVRTSLQACIHVRAVLHCVVLCTRVYPRVSWLAAWSENCNCRALCHYVQFIAIFWVSLLSFAAISLCVASRRMFIIVADFVMDSVRKLLDTLS
jgi:hypothetical protein